MPGRQHARLCHAFLVYNNNNNNNKKHLKNVGPIRHCEPPPHCNSPGVANVARGVARRLRIDVHDNNNDNDDNDNA